VRQGGLVPARADRGARGRADRRPRERVNPDAVFGGSQLWSEEVRRERAGATASRSTSSRRSMRSRVAARPRGDRARRRRDGRLPPSSRPLTQHDRRRDPA
jgi:hypothetical protein